MMNDDDVMFIIDAWIFSSPRDLYYRKHVKHISEIILKATPMRSWEGTRRGEEEGMTHL